MRKLSLTLSIFLTMTLAAPVLNAATPKAGDRCKKVNRTIQSGGQDLVCKKRGARNVWVVANKQQPKPTPSASSSATQEPEAKGITRAEVAAKNSPSNCWTIIGNKVYDLTQWVSRHPGGSSAIASICGMDGTSRFKSQHASSGRANGTLDGYYIGDLKS
jgi:hypothetical protein